MAVVFFSYSHADEAARDRLEKHLSVLRRQQVIETWHDRRIVAGDALTHRIDAEIERADVILLLVSPDFIASDYCYDIEMRRAMERHTEGSARVIPIILRHCDWHDTPFGGLTAAPKDGRPINTWPDLDEAFLDVVRAIKTAVAAAPASSSPPPQARAASVGVVREDHTVRPRSSNLRIKKHFTDADKDRHCDEAFEFMARFFETSLAELQQRNTGLETAFRRIDADSFTAIVYQNGSSVSECRIVRGGFVGNGITYSANARSRENSYNDSLSVDADDEGLFLKAMMSMGRQRDEPQLTFEGAAEYYWSMLIDRLR